MRVAVGCPVLNRAWCLEAYYEHIDQAFAHVGLTPEYLHAYTPGTDNTGELLRGEVVEVPGDRELGIKRSWNVERYGHLAVARNALLGLVWASDPDLFLSCDSDILLAPEALADLLETSAYFDAVGGGCYMTPADTAPSYAYIDTDHLVRPDAHDVRTVDVIMAIKLMGKRAYHTPYSVHRFGEDIAWSLACRTRGLTLGWDGRHFSFHAMNRERFLNAQQALSEA